MKNQRLNFKAASRKTVEGVIDTTKNILQNVGVEIESPVVKELLYSHGVEFTKQSGRAYDVALIKPELVDMCIATVPHYIKMYNRDGSLTAILGENNTYFNPGSCGNNYFDCRTNEHRKATKKDLTEFVRIADALPHIAMVSTSMNVDSVDKEIQDVYRLAVVLQNSTKPIVTGTFNENFEIMKDMLVAVRGDELELEDKPFAIFDCCPSPALKWPKIWSEDLIRCGDYGIPAQFISMPQPGLSGPITLYDSLIQHTAETFSGIVISQLANPGAPLIYGGSPTMIAKNSNSTALLGDIGTVKLDTAYIAIAKHLNLPCQAYLGLSDSKKIDVQAGYEKGITTILAALAGINNVSGPGMLESENCQSKEMLIIDNEFCGAALYFVKGIKKQPTNSAVDVAMMAQEGMPNPDSLAYLQEEYYSSRIADKSTLAGWNSNGKKSMLENAIIEADRILIEHEIPPLPDEIIKEVNKSLNIKCH